MQLGTPARRRIATRTDAPVRVRGQSWASRGTSPAGSRRHRYGPAMRRFLLNTVAAAFWVPRLVRTALYRVCGLDVAWDARLTPAITITGTQLTIGHRSNVNFRSIIDCRAPVTIGDRCGIGMGVQIITGTHDASNPGVRAGKLILEPITIDDGCWIGSGAIVLAGATIGEGCIIAA